MVLGSEPLSEEANRQRIEFLRRLESVSRPPSLPPRPAHLSELYRAHVQQQTEAIPSGSLVPDESNLYKNDGTLDPVEFASQQRELSRVANLYKTYGLPPTYAPQTVVLGEKGSKNGGLYFPRQGNTPFSRVSLRRTISLRFLIYLSLYSLMDLFILNLPLQYVTKFVIQCNTELPCGESQLKYKI